MLYITSQHMRVRSFICYSIIQVNVEVRSPQDGNITETFAQVGDEVSVGNPLFSLTPGTSSTSVNTVPTKTVPVIENKVSAPVASAAPASSSTSPKPAAVEKKSTPVVGTQVIGDRSETRVKMTRMRQRISQRLKEAQNTAAMLTTFQEVDMGYLIDMRNKYKDEFEKIHGVKLGFMSAFVKVRVLILYDVTINIIVIIMHVNLYYTRHQQRHYQKYLL